MTKVTRTRALALVAAGGLACLGLLGGGAGAAMACAPLSLTIGSPVVVAPATEAIVNGTVNVSGTSSGLPLSATLRVFDATGTSQVGADHVAVVGTNGGVPPSSVSGALDTTTLTDGSYTLELSAVGCGSPTARVKVLVDNTAPVLSFTSGPAEGATVADGAAAAFAFASAADLTGPVAFQCAYDGAAVAACGSPAPTVTLAPGSHSFRVVGTDRAGNSSAIVRSFTVAQPPAPVESSSDGQPTAPVVSCRVPRLRGLTLAAARTKLRRAHCRLGRVSKPPARVLRLRINRGQRLVVQRQTEKPGAVRPSNQPVGVALVVRRDLKLG